MRKELDLLLNMLGNPDSTLLDLMNSGLSTDNTSLESLSTYANSPQILSNPIFLDNTGKFDTKKLTNTYNTAVSGYNFMATEAFNKKAIDLAKYSPLNIFAPIEKRETSPNIVYHKMPNPDRITLGLSGINKYSTPLYSLSELAQTLEVVDFKTGKKMASPNDNWFKYLDDTLVLAQYDETEDINGKKEGEAGFDKDNIAHMKGLPKLNENGTYYYETLGGRDVTGRKVLWKGDTLTTDGSWANKHLDFFDSDDIELNSSIKTILKNTALVGSMFLPVVGPYVRLLSVGIQTAGFLGTAGRILSGNTSDFFNNLEGWGRSMNRQEGRTDAARQNPWSLEGFLNLSADVLGLLAEQRAVFEYVPKWFKGSGVDEKSLELLKAKYTLELFDATKSTQLPKVTAEMLSNPMKLAEYAKTLKTLQLDAATRATSKVSEYVKDYYDLGAKISKAYMTGITTATSYGEALRDGANPLDAALFSIGYAAAEYALLSTAIGEWILPERRLQSAEHRKIVQKAFEQVFNPENKASVLAAATTLAEKSKIVLRIMNLGKEVAHADYSLGKRMIGNTLANSLGEGVEEVSEELLLDMAKQVHNVLHWLGGSDTRLTAWENMKDRYLLSFFGGLMGGGLAGVSLNNLDYAKSINNMTSEVAMQKLVAIARDEKLRAAFLKNLDKLEIGYKDLSASKYVTDDNGNFIGWELGTETDNLEYQIKLAVRNTLDFIDNLLEAEGAKLNDDSLLKNVIKDVRFALLTQSHAGERIISRFNNIMTQIFAETMNLKAIESPENKARNGDTDLADGESEKTKKQRQGSEERLKELIKEKDDLLAGKYSAELALEALIEMNSYVHDKLQGMSFIRYAETKSGMKINEIPEDLFNVYLSDYLKHSSTLGKDEIAVVRDFYTTQSLNVISSLLKLYDAIDQNNEALSAVIGLTAGLNSRLNMYNTEGYKTPIEYLQEVLDEKENQRLDVKVIPTIADGLYTPEEAEQMAQSRDEELEYLNAVDEARIIYDGVKERLNLAKEKLKDSSDEEREAIESEIADLQVLADSAKSEYDFKNNAYQELVITNNSRYLNNTLERVLDKIELATLAGFMNSHVKNLLDKALYTLFSLLSVNGTYNDEVFPEDRRNDLGIRALNLRNKVALLPHTPIQEFLDKFIIDSKLSNINVTQLLTTLNTRFDSLKEVSDFLLDDTLSNQINEAIALADVLEGVLYGARVDKLGIDIVQNGERDFDLNPNYFGINAVVKHLANAYDGDEKYKTLPEIEGLLADLAILDLLVLKNQLVFYKDLFNINTGLKLSRLNRVKANLSYLIYNAVSNFVVTIPDWEGKDELKTVLDSMTITKKYGADTKNKVLLLSDEDLKTLLAEHIALAKGVHDFFNLEANKNKTIEEYAEIFNPRTLKLLESSNTLLTENTSAINGLSFVTWMASVSAIDPIAFYKVYLDVNVAKIAPVPGLEFAILSVVAARINGNLTTKFYKATLKGMLDYFLNEENETIRTRKFKDVGLEFLNTEELRKFIINDGRFLKYMNFVLVEGIPGAGKTLGVIKVAREILKQIEGFDNSKVWYVHTSADKAKALDDDTKKDKKYFGHQDLLTHISTYKLSLQKDEKGNTIIPREAIKIAENGLICSSADLLKIDDVPQFLIIDEVSKYNNVEIELINRFAETYGVVVFSLGDFGQSSAKGLVKSFILDMSFLVKLSSGEFPGPMKLGDSFRVTNILKSKNLAVLLVKPAQIPLHAHYNKNGVYGDLYYNNLGFDPLDLESQMDHMISALPEGGKIGYIYYDENCPSAKVMNSPKYKDYITPYYRNPALGDELQFFVIDFTNYLGTEDDEYEDFYTAVTRSSQGSIIIANTIAGRPIIRKIDNITYDSSLGEQEIESYTKNSKKLLGSVLEGKESPKLKLIPLDTNADFKALKNPPAKVETPLVGVKTEIGKEGSDISGTEFRSEGDMKDTNYKETLSGNASDINYGNLIHIDDDGNFHLTLALYTHASLETGITKWNNDGTPDVSNIPPGILKKRLDSAFGLIKNGFLPANERYKFAIMRKISLLNDILLDSPNKTEMERALIDALGEANLRAAAGVVSGSLEITITFDIKNSANASGSNIWNNVGNDPNNPRFGRFGKSMEETLEGIYIEDKKAKLAKRRLVIAVISVMTKDRSGKSRPQDVLELPIGTLSSPLTFINTTDASGNYIMPDVKDIYEVGMLKYNGNMYDALRYTVDTLIDRGEQTKYADLIELSTLWMNSANYAIPLNDPTWVPAMMKNLGVLVDLVKGLRLEDLALLMYDAKTEEPISLLKYAENPKYSISSIFVTSKTLRGLNGVYVKAGNPIILWSDTLGMTDDLLIAEFKRSLQDPNTPSRVKFAYVNSPRYTVTEYLESLIRLPKKEGVPVGTIFTAFLILQKLAYDELGNRRQEFKDFCIEKLGEEDIYETLMAQLDELREMKPDDSIKNAEERYTKYYKDLKNVLLRPSEIFKNKTWAPQDASTASLLLRILLNATLNYKFATKEYVSIKLNVEVLNEMAGDYRVWLQVRLVATEGLDPDFIRVATDSGNQYKLNDREFTLSSKLTSRAYIENEDSQGQGVLMQWVRDANVELRTNYLHASDGYINNSSGVRIKMTPTESLILKFENRYDIDLLEFKDLDEEDALKEICNKINESSDIDEIVLPINKGMFISTVNLDFKEASVDLDEMETDNYGVTTVNFTLADGTEGTITVKNGRPSVSTIKEVEPETEVSYESILLNYLNNYKTITETIPMIGMMLSNKISDLSNPDNKTFIKNTLLDLRFKKMLETLKNNPDPDVLTNAKNLEDFLYKELLPILESDNSTKVELDTDSNSCNVKVKNIKYGKL